MRGLKKIIAHQGITFVLVLSTLAACTSDDLVVTNPPPIEPDPTATAAPEPAPPATAAPEPAPPATAAPVPVPTATAAPEPVPPATAAPVPPQVTPAPTAPSAPWYRCEFADYALSAADYRVVNIPADDPDGGLVAHASPGVDADVTEILPDGTDELSVAGCQRNPNLTSVWWLVQGRGWVNANYLQASTSFGNTEWQPGLSAPINSDQFSTLLGLEAPDLETLATSIGETLAGQEFTIVELGDFIGLDAQGGIAGYDLLGLGDDSIGGYRLELRIGLIKDETATDILGYRVTGVVGWAICSRGVSGGLCI